MIGLAIALQGLELLGWTTLSYKLKSSARREILTHGVRQPQRLPIVDDQLKSLAGTPNKFVRLASGRIVAIVRRIVNTRAFEHLVTGAINPKSELRKKFAKPIIVRVL